MRPIAYCREVLENANELRVMLCKDKLMTSNSGTQKRGTTVLAACGRWSSLLPANSQSFG